MAAETSAPQSESQSPLPGPRLRAADRSNSRIWLDRELLADWHIRLSILVLAALIFFPGIGSFGLWDPWEVHYGEVGRQMIEREDWISPWWGSHWRAPEKTPEGEYFFSKPVLLLWMMGLGMQVFGFSEIGVRFGVAFIALLGVMSAYFAGSRIWNVRVGVLMAAALLTSPFYFMLGRQAQTDMPFVGTMTVALCFFMAGVFGRDRNRPVDRTSWWIFVAFLMALVLPQLHTITVGQLDWDYNGDWKRLPEAIICWGPTQLAIYTAMLGTFFVTAVKSEHRTRGQLYLYVFYCFIGLATMGKGILGFALPGAIIFFYLLTSREWGLLGRVELFRGVLLALAVGFPWYGAMFARHGGIGGAFWDRFIIHDHFKRLSSGVHQTDSGSFEHFIKWLGYGLFPWGSFIPAILARAMAGTATGARTDQQRARTFLFLWFATAFTLFTLSSTKFHHYIFPVVPAVALLAALFIDDVLEKRISHETFLPLYVASAALFGMVAYDLANEPQHLKNMFTYRYDREWPSDDWNPHFLPALRIMVGVSGIGFLLFAFQRFQKVAAAGLVVMALTGLGFATWTLNVYMPVVARSWSQGNLWQAYYDRCTLIEPPPGTSWIKADRYCLESAISYKLNWRGETFYTQNDVLPIRDDDEWNYFIEQNGDRCFYAIMEHSRVGGFRNALPSAQRASVQVVHDENIKFALVSANCPAEPSEDGGDAAGDGSGPAADGSGTR
jgi:4-amino-4-deoxy-L-arabinose transferase-like glycosyltransferase